MRRLRKIAFIIIVVMIFSTLDISFSNANEVFCPEIDVDTENSSTEITPLGVLPYTVMNLGGFTFTGSNRGKYHTVKGGTKMRIWFKYKSADNNPYVPYLWVYCYQYGGKLMKKIYSEFGSRQIGTDGYMTITSDWFSFTPGVDYRLEYECGTVAGGSKPPRTIKFKQVSYQIK